MKDTALIKEIINIINKTCDFEYNEECTVIEVSDADLAISEIYYLLSNEERYEHKFNID